MRLGVLAGFSGDWQETLEKVQIAEELGYELVATGEAWGPSIVPWLSTLAANTEKIQIGSSIFNCFSRSPAAIAQEFAALEVISGGRMVCGLGSSGNLVIEGFHGAEFDRPLRRLREYTEIIKMLLRGERLAYEGQIYQLARGFRIDYDMQREDVPVYIAAITPRSIEQTAQIADGIFPIHWPLRAFQPLRDQLAAASTAAGRPADSVTIAPFTNVYVLGEGQDDDEVWRNARQPLFHYTNRMGSFYWQMLARSGFEADVAASRDAWSERDAEGALMAFSDEMVREIQVIGPLEEVRERLQERSDAGAQLQMVQMPGGSPEEAGKRLEAYLR